MIRTIKIKDTKKCLECKEVFKIFKTTDQFCSPKCYHSYNKPEKIEARHREAKESVRGDNVFEYLQTEINKIIRLIDRGHKCISSGLEYGKFYPNAGHYYSVGSNKTLRYNLLNIYVQSANDNNEGGGKGSNYGNGLIETFGMDVFNEINSLPSKYKRIDLTRLEAREALKICRQITKEIQIADAIFSTDYRIQVRKTLNKRIGIYN